MYTALQFRFSNSGFVSRATCGWGLGTKLYKSNSWQNKASHHLFSKLQDVFEDVGHNDGNGGRA